MKRHDSLAGLELLQGMEGLIGPEPAGKDNLRITGGTIGDIKAIVGSLSYLDTCVQ